MNQRNLSQVLRCRRRSGSPIDAPPTAALSHQPAMLGDAISVGTGSADIWRSAALCRNRSCMTDALGTESLHLRRRGCPMRCCVAIAVGRCWLPGIVPDAGLLLVDAVALPGDCRRPKQRSLRSRWPRIGPGPSSQLKKISCPQPNVSGCKGVEQKRYAMEIGPVT